jgi:ribosomal protein S18 acetylase RimI-like enzyme
MITVRPMAAGDAPAVGAVHVRAWQVAYRGVFPDEHLAGLRAKDRAAMWRRGIEDGWPGRRDVVTVGGRVAGFAAYGPERGGVDPARGELYALNIDPEDWRSGLGRLLLRHAMTELGGLGCTHAVLWVAATNHRALRFYESAGWLFDGSQRTETIEDTLVEELRYAHTLSP